MIHRKKSHNKESFKDIPVWSPLSLFSGCVWTSLCCVLVFIEAARPVTHPWARPGYLGRQQQKYLIYNLWQRDDPSQHFIIHSFFFSCFDFSQHLPNASPLILGHLALSRGLRCPCGDMQTLENNSYSHCAPCQRICIFMFILGARSVWGLLWMCEMDVRHLADSTEDSVNF